MDAILGDCKARLRDIPDTLARRGALLSQDFVIFLEPPSDVSLLLSLDAIRAAFDRSVSDPVVVV